MRFYKPIIAVIAIAFFIFAIKGNAGISGSKHDFSNASYSAWNSGAEICEPCHTPHNAKAITQAPLWNHTASAITNYTLYSSTTLDSTTAQPSGSAKLCLSCHDGTVALENFGTTTTGTHYLTGTSLLGTDLSNDHPISMTYNANTAQYNATSTTISGFTGGHTTISSLLENGKVQCASCHDAHGGQASTKMLLKSNTGSQLCLTCHIK